jgi:hypothetical protein
MESLDSELPNVVELWGEIIAVDTDINIVLRRPSGFWRFAEVDIFRLAFDPRCRGSTSCPGEAEQTWKSPENLCSLYCQGRIWIW